MIEKRAKARKVQAAGKAMRFGPALMARLDALAAFTEVPGQLTRRYLSPAHVDAMRQVEAWMAEAGMRVRTDPLCSVFGRYEGRTAGAPAIMLGSHIDTVVDAGLYDGALGVLAAIAVVADMARRGERLDHAIEVAAFGEEEGSRFSAHILTSSALIGAVKPALLDVKDSDGITVREALAAVGGDAKAYRACVRKRSEIAAYLEFHIEQGPVLDDKGLALAAVTAINGSMRLAVAVEGFAGHAGTVPMGSRRDALAAAAEMVLAVERLAAGTPDVVATVGRIKALPGATNVIPGSVEFTLDMRSPSDSVRRRAGKMLLSTLREIAERRGVKVEAETYQENPAVALDPGVIDAVAETIAACGHEPLRLASGAGHDAMIMQKLCPSGMIFLRCKDGISHNPAEQITVEDADVGVRVLLETVRRLDKRLRGPS
jgi:hydantoinase/carbamoylase family amidase